MQMVENFTVSYMKKNVPKDSDCMLVRVNVVVN